jgi:hypothetical protein
VSHEPNCSMLESWHSRLPIAGGLAQLARALALQARGHRFDSDILHKSSFKQ